jgi:cardiolipin synthase A/B
VTLSIPSSPSRAIPPDRDALDLAIGRATGARPLGGNLLLHHADSPRAIDAMLELIAGAKRWVHFENYIIRHDRTGRRFAEALAERARAGVRVRVLYDALGSLGTSGRYWRALKRAGVDVRAFHPLLSPHFLDALSRDHRKLIVVDGTSAMMGGLCIGDEWVGNPGRGCRPWRDSMVSISGPAAAAADITFGRIWERAGTPLPPEELEPEPTQLGPGAVRVVSGTPWRARMYRALQFLAASARERLWLTDAYLIAPQPLFAALLDAARDGVDVRLLVPGTSDIAVIRTFTRVGYRELLHAGARIYEYRGPMLHAKTFVVDQRWARVGSSNLNVSSLLGNYELDLIAESEEFAGALADQFLRDVESSQEVVLQPGRRFMPARLVRAPGTAPLSVPEHRHRRSRYEIGAAAVVAVRRVAGGVRRTIGVTAALTFATLGGLLLVFPRAMSIALATGAFLLALGSGAYALERRRSRESDDP